MRRQPLHLIRTVVCLAILFAFAFLAPVSRAQSGSSSTSASPSFSAPVPAVRIVQPVEDSHRTVLHGNTYFLARPQYDAGPAPDSLPMQRMLMVLQRGPAQEAALEQLLQDQQNAASSNYHKWLTPQQFGAQFGPAPQDIQTIVSWLQYHGFTVNRISNGSTVIDFSGTAGQVQSAFATSIHRYTVNGASHWANSSDPSIPAALSPVVAGLVTLHNFPRHAMNVRAGIFKKDPSTGLILRADSSAPQATFQCGSANGSFPCYGIGPYDLGAIYNYLPLWNTSPAVDGTGQTIAIIGESDVDKKDMESFQQFFGLSTKDPVVILDGPDPGVVPGDETESDIDLEWSGAVAKGATIDFVIAAATNTSLGVDLAALHAVDENVAPILSESYGICEAGLGTSGNQFYNSLWQQAAAEGISVFVSAGDNGSAGCDDHDAAPPAPAEFGLQVSGFASTPYNVAVGGTDFNDLSNPSTYWSSSTSSTTQQSARGYIPEVPWNDTCTSAALIFYGYSSNALTNCNDSNLVNIVVWTVGGSGGKSSCTSGDGQDITSCSGGYAKPTWQSGTGVPSDGKRDIPDVSLYASAGFYTNSFYIVCAADQTDNIYCTPQNFEFAGYGGTSVSSPAFAGIMALVLQKTGSRQGNPNYALYNVAAQSGARCTSSGTPPSTCVFYDINTGTNAMPCDDTGQFSRPVNCSSPGPLGIGILTGYSSTAGYDLVTGLGSVNAANLVQKWSNFALALKSSATTLSLSPTTSITHGSPVTVTIGVSAVSPATGTPTGEVSLEASSLAFPGITSFPLVSGAVSGTTNVLPGGSYSVTAHYPGDSAFSASDSSPAIPITVTPENSTVKVSAITQNNQGVISTFVSGPYGSAPIYPRVDVAGLSGNGYPSGSVTLLDNGNSIDGGLTLALNRNGNALPTNAIFTFSPGTHTLTASYTGDSSFNAVAAPSSTPATFSISQASLSAQLSAPLTISLGSPANLSVVLNGTSCGNVPTGTVTFFNGATQLGTPQTIQASQVLASCTITATASLSASAFSQGSNSVTARYNGDANYAAVTSAAQTVDARANSTATLSANPTSFQQGQSVTLNITVAAAQQGGPVPTGSVTFSSSGPGVSLPSVPLSNGQGQLMTTALPSGNYQLFANYGGDTNYANSQSAGISMNVTPAPDFNITFSPLTVNVSSPGQSASTMVTVTGSNGFNTPISFAGVSCAGLPSESSCSFNPTMVSPGSSTMLTISTTAPSSLVPSGRPSLPGLFHRVEHLALAASLAARLLLFSILAALFVLPFRRRERRWLAPVFLFGLLLLNSACGGGSSGTTNPGTPQVQNQTISITITSGTTTHTFSFTLNVN